MSKFVVKHVAVLGAGVMGAQIAAHLANAGVPVTLFDLAAPEGDRNGIVKKALAGEQVEESVAVPTLVLTKDVLDAGTEPMLQYVK